MCVDARRYGCTAEMLAYTTHEQRYLGSDPRVLSSSAHARMRKDSDSEARTAAAARGGGAGVGGVSGVDG